MEMRTKWEPKKHMGRKSPERTMWGRGCEGEKGAALRKRMRRGTVRRTHTCHLPESFNSPWLTPTRTWLCRIPLFQCPPSPTSLTFVTGAGGEQGGQQEGQQQEGHGVVWAGQGRARRSLSRKSLQPADSTLGEGCRGSPRKGGKIAGRAAVQGQKRARRAH